MRFRHGGSVRYPPFYDLASEIVTNVLRGFLITIAVAAVRITASARRRGLAVALLFLVAAEAKEPISLYDDLFARPAKGDPAAWQYPMVALALSGLLIVLIWLLAFPKGDAIEAPRLSGSGRRRSMLDGVMPTLRDPTAWATAAILSCCNFVYLFAIGRLWMLDWVTSGAMTKRDLIAVFTPPIAFLVFAFWSDRILRRTRSWFCARAPFIVGGFLVGGLLPLLTNGMFPGAWFRTLPYHIEITATTALGLGAMQVANLLATDLAPRRTAGTYIGSVLTAGAATVGMLGPIREAIPFETDTAIPHLVLPLAVVGALASVILLALARPQDDHER